MFALQQTFVAEHPSRDDQDGDGDRCEFELSYAAIFNGYSRNIASALDPFGSEIEQPRQNQCHWKSKRYQEDRQADCPIRDVENRENLRNPLSQCPTGDNITDGDPVD